MFKRTVPKQGQHCSTNSKNIRDTGTLFPGSGFENIYFKQSKNTQPTGGTTGHVNTIFSRGGDGGIIISVWLPIPTELQEVLFLLYLALPAFSLFWWGE